MAEGDGLDSARRNFEFQRWLDRQEKDIEVMSRLIESAFRAGWEAARKVPASDH